MATAEGKIQSAVCKFLAGKGCFFFRVNNAPVFDKKLNSGYGGYRLQGYWTPKGVPDIVLITKTGKFIGLEIKAPKGRLSPDQQFFSDRCKRNQAEYHVIHSLDEIKALAHLWG